MYTSNPYVSALIGLTALAVGVVTGLLSCKRNTRRRRHSGMKYPTASLHLHYRQLLLLAEGAWWDGTTTECPPPDHCPRALTAILLAAAGAEAFINEMAGVLFSEAAARRDWAPTSERSKCFVEAVSHIEDRHGPTLAKYEAAVQALTGKSIDKRAAFFHDFKLLFDLRNAIMHRKPHDTTAEQIREQFIQRRYIPKRETNVHSSWFDDVQTCAVAAWAVGAARDMILLVAEAGVTPGLNEFLDTFALSLKEVRGHPGFAPWRK